MLDGLDDVDWAGYGSERVRNLLRALASDDREERWNAFHGSFDPDGVVHQGTVYRVTEPAVPFLYELLAAPNVRDKFLVATVIAEVAAGRGFIEAHANSSFARTAMAERSAAKGLTLEDEMATEAVYVAAVRRAASVRLLDLLPYLNSPEPTVRETVAAAFAGYPEHAAKTLPALRAVVNDADEAVRNAARASLERLGAA